MMRIFVCALAVVLVGFGTLSCGRAGVEVSEGYLMTTDVVMFVVQSCHQQPQLELLRETADEVQVKATHQHQGERASLSRCRHLPVARPTWRAQRGGQLYWQHCAREEGSSNGPAAELVRHGGEADSLLERRILGTALISP